MEKNCILCGDPLNKYPTNREHYVPQVLIREFDKLCIPSEFDWALRANYYTSANAEQIVVPRAQHKVWAVVEVHQVCNQDASDMCRDLRYIIDHMGEHIDPRYFERPIEYYAHLWSVSKAHTTFTLLSREDAENERDESGSDSMILYRPGLLACGRIKIECDILKHQHDFERHTIYLGTRESFA